MGKKYNVLSRNERIQIEALCKANIKPKQIAEILGRGLATIYRELKRGKYIRRNSDYTESESYSSDLAQMRYDKLKREKGKELKVGNNLKVIRYLERLMINYRYSPYAASIKLKKREKEFGLSLYWRTIYNYIEKGVFLNLKLEHLPVKRERKRNKKRRVQKQRSAGVSIEKRMEEVESREEFGHWEMDTVVGKRGKSKKSLLVLTERKTRKELILMLKNHTAAEVVKKINYIEKQLGTRMFRNIFKSITVDNGTEFSLASELTKSRRSAKPRTKVFYCHPYSSWERGSNEVANKLIRRFIPKGTDFDEYGRRKIRRIEEWINNYPRELFGGASSNDLYKKEIALAIMNG